MHGRGVCHVEFFQLFSAKKAIFNHKSFPLRIHDQPLFINYAVDVVEVGEPSRLLWVTGLDTSKAVDLEELKGIFEEFGEVENIILSAYFYLPFAHTLTRDRFRHADRKGLPSCIVRYSSVEEADEAIQAHRKKRLRHHGLALQIRYSTSKPHELRTPNPTLHIMGFRGDHATLLSYIPNHAQQVKDLWMSMCRRFPPSGYH